jgi:hypothetical protein
MVDHTVGLRRNMNDFYMLLVTYPGSSQQHIANTGTKAISAKPENRHLLVEMGEKLLDDNTISSYTIMTNVSREINRADPATDFGELYCERQL